MGFLGFRKVINLGGGFRLNVGKKGVGISAGVKGFRAGVGPGGTRMRASIPGTGIYYEERSSSKKNQTKSSPQPTLCQLERIQLGFFEKLTTPPDEILFLDAVNSILEGRNDLALPKLREVVRKNASFVDAFFCIALTSSDEEQLRAVESLLVNKNQYLKHFNKYKISIGTDIHITDELKVQIINDELGLILLAAEVFQEHDLQAQAIHLLKHSGFTEQRVVVLSLGELYFDTGCFEDSIRMLQQLENNDSIGTTALLYQGLALRKLKQYDATVEILKSALKRKKGRSKDFLLEVQYQLAITYEMAGNTKKAKKEYEKILTERYDFKDIRNKLQLLTTNSGNSTVKVLKGQRSDINSKKGKIIVVAGWTNLHRGVQCPDVDFAAFLLKDNGRVTDDNDIVFYGHPESADKTIIHLSKSSLQSGGSAQFIVDLNRMSDNIDKISFAITIYDAKQRSQNFGELSDIYLSIIDEHSGNELLRFGLTDSLINRTAIVMAELYRYNKTWKLNPIGSSFLGGLKTLCENFGIHVV